MDKIVDSFLNLIFPKRCVGCSTVGSYFCASCLEVIGFCEIQTCPECRQPSIGGFVHPLCRRPWGAERTLCPFKFEGPIEKAIKALKYGGVRDLADELADLVLASFADQNISFGQEAVILPVPLHPIKRLERGFNQTDLLAQSLGRRLALSVWADLLLRQKETPSQTRLNLEQRATNVRGAFRLSEESPKARSLRDRDVIIVDDVFTSGATLRECAQVIKRAGARFVYLLAVAKD